MDIKTFLKILFGTWAVLIFATYLTDPEMRPSMRVAATGVLALLVALLSVVALRKEKAKHFSLCDPATGQVIYRVEGEWIFRGDEEKATWYCKRGAVYSFDSMKPLYRVKDKKKVCREGEKTPVWTVEDKHVVDCASGQTVYIMK